MSRKPKRPELTCSRCGLPIVVIPVGKKYRACDGESTTVITAEGAVVVGYRRHVCPESIRGSRKARKPKAQALPVGEDQCPITMAGDQEVPCDGCR